MLVYNMAEAKKNKANAAVLQQQFNYLTNWRQDSRHSLEIKPNRELANVILEGDYLQAVNAGRKPFDLYREFDPVIIRQFHLDEGDNFLMPLMGLSRNVSLGITIDEFGRSSGMGNFTTSLSGEVGAVYDNVDYDTDKTIVPFHQTGWKFGFREDTQMGLESFNGAMINQEEAARRHKVGLVDGFLDGWKDKDGNYIVKDGVSWQGFRNDPRVDQVDLSTSPAFDFTDNTQSGEDFIAAFTVLAQRHNITNKITAPITYFVSNEIWWNMSRDYSTQKGDNTILARCRAVPNVADIIPSSALSGNQVLSMALESRFIQPIVGLAVGSVALARPNYNSPYAFETISAIGLQIKTDFASTNTAVQYASS